MEQVAIEAHRSDPDAEVTFRIQRVDTFRQPGHRHVARGTCDEISRPPQDPIILCLG